MIAIASYGLGNVSAFATVFRQLGVPHKLATTPGELAGATKVILPGVGAFDHAMTKLQQSGLMAALQDMVVIKGIPALGVCVGLQMMASGSDEGSLPGLGWIPGRVRRLPGSPPGGEHPLPHMGWNTLERTKNDPILSDLPASARFYFLHSYYFDCTEPSHILACAQYGMEFPCLVRRDNIYGMQCHPEKSHQNGILILRNFARL